MGDGETPRHSRALNGVRLAQSGPPFHPAKLRAPRLTASVVRRGRLTALLAAARPSLTLLVAPPGFGKTSLLAEWCEADRRPFAWVTADSQDNDRAVLWTYIAEALASVHDAAESHDLRALARNADPAAAIAGELAAAPVETVLVLDDYHLIEAVECHESITRFVERAPAGLQVVISGRLEPPLQIARLRAAGALAELRSQQLRFTPHESRQYLVESLGMALAPGAVDVLHRRTEGWPAGLYLAYLSLRHTADKDAFVRTFGASNRHVGDYLSEQVLASLDEPTLDFLLDTSILERVCGPLADAVLRTRGSGERLSELERVNGFVVPLDDRREWYRYHNLLAGLLRIELQRRRPDRIAELHRRASDWYAAVGLIDPAIRHAISAGDAERAAQLISATYLRQIEWGRIATVESWLREMGAETVEADRRLGVVKAWTMHFQGRHEEGDAALATASRSTHPSSDGQPLPDGASSIEATRALIGAAFPGGDVGSSLAAARLAFELEATRPSPWAVTVHNMLGFALVRAGKFEEARHPLEVAVATATESQMWMDAVGAHALLGRVDLMARETGPAEHHARQAIRLAEIHRLTQSPTYAYARATLGAVLVRKGDVEAGEGLLVGALAATRAFGEPLSLAELLLALSNARRLLGKRSQARTLRNEANAIIDGLPDPGVLRRYRRRHAGSRAGLREALSPRELEVLELLSRGISKGDASKKLFVSYDTIHSHAKAIYRKLGVHSRSELVTRARELHLIS